jgi:hypothetical protein
MAYRRETSLRKELHLQTINETPIKIKVLNALNATDMQPALIINKDIKAFIRKKNSKGITEKISSIQVRDL